jgi:hypothetical protein
MHEGLHFLYASNISPSWSEPHQPESGSLSKHAKQEKAKSKMKNLTPRNFQLSADALDANETSSKIAHLCVWGCYSWTQRRQRKCHISITFPELQISSLLLRQYVGGQKSQSWIIQTWVTKLFIEMVVARQHQRKSKRSESIMSSNSLRDIHEAQSIPEANRRRIIIDVTGI